MSEIPVGGICWTHPRRGKQELEVILSCPSGDTVILRHTDEKVGAKRTYIPRDQVAELIAVLQHIEPTIAVNQQPSLEDK